MKSSTKKVCGIVGSFLLKLALYTILVGLIFYVVYGCKVDWRDSGQIVPCAFILGYGYWNAIKWLRRALRHRS